MQVAIIFKGSDWNRKGDLPILFYSWGIVSLVGYYQIFNLILIFLDRHFCLFFTLSTSRFRPSVVLNKLTGISYE